MIVGLFIFIILIIPTTEAKSHRVHGYHRANGHYVRSYHRTRGNHTRRDNYSHVGNISPWTGKRGTHRH